MKIDEATINSTALRLIKNVSEDFYDFISREDCDKWGLVTLAEIKGICMLADELKEVLEG